jgi:hypothetical protein
MLAFELSIPMPPNPDAHTREIGHAVNRQSCNDVLAFLDARLKGRKDELRRHRVAAKKSFN